MGSFAGFLGDAAGGFAQAAREDKQRQFQAEMDRRDQIANMLGKLASDPTAHPDTRQNAFQMALETLHAAPGKVVKPDINRLITTGPKQPTQTATTPAPAAAPQHDLTNLIPQGQPMPTPPTSAGQPMPQLPQQAQFMPPPNVGMRYTPEEQATMAASAAGKVAGAEAGAVAKYPIYQRTPEGIKQGFASGIGQPMGGQFEDVFSPMWMRGMAAGMHPVLYNGPNGPLPGLQDKIGVRGQMGAVYDQQGQMVPDAQVFAPSLVGSQHAGAVTDPLTGLTTKSSSATVKTPPGGGKAAPIPTPPGMAALVVAQPTRKVGARGAGGPTAAAAAAPVAADNTIGGRALPPQAIGIIAAQARNYERSGIAPSGKTAPIVQQYMAEHGMVPHTTQQVSDYQKAFDLAMSEDRRYKMMDDLQKKVQADPSPENIGSYDAALLAYHMGMTVGQVKGMRSGRDMVMLHEHARSLPESLRTAAEGWVNGAQLSPQQHQNFVDLAKQSRKSAWDMAVSQARGMGFTRYPQPQAGLPALGVVPGTINRQGLGAIAKDHQITYGEARKQAAAAGYNIED